MASKEAMRDISRQDFRSSQGETIEAISAGSLQRIADATEKMAQDYDRLKRNAEMYECWYRQQLAYSRKLERSNSALRGVITKLKRKAQTSADGRQ